MASRKRSIRVRDNFWTRRDHLKKVLNEVEKSLNKHNNHERSVVPKLEDLSNSYDNGYKIRGFKGQESIFTREENIFERQESTFKCQESIFKRPKGPARRAKIQTISSIANIPDYQRNPGKWTYYSLEDVPEMTEESNREAAFAFLNELRQRREREEIERRLKERFNRGDSMEIGTNESIMEEDDDDLEEEESFDINDESKTSISFKKPKKEEACIEKVKSEFRGNKVIMPEYEIGTKKVSIKIKKNKFHKISLA